MYVDEGFNERIESKRENVGGVGTWENVLVFYFVSFGMFCVLNGSGMETVTFSWGCLFLDDCFYYNDFLIIQSTLFYKIKNSNLHEFFIFKKEHFY